MLITSDLYLVRLIILYLFFINLINKDQIYFNYALILGIGIVLKSCEVLFSYFEAKSLSKYIVLSQMLGLILSALIILYIIINDLDLIYIYFALVLIYYY